MKKQNLWENDEKGQWYEIEKKHNKSFSKLHFTDRPVIGLFHTATSHSHAMIAADFNLEAELRYLKAIEYNASTNPNAVF